MAAAPPGTDQPAAPAAKIKTASHTKFLRVPSAIDCSTVLGRVLDPACAPCDLAFADGQLGEHACPTDPALFVVGSTALDSRSAIVSSTSMTIGPIGHR